jgi:hypothetical protein
MRINCRDWGCKNGNRHERSRWLKRLQRVDWDSMVTLTTMNPYTRDGVKGTRRQFRSLLRFLRRNFGQFKYIAIMVPANGKIHIHIAYKGPPLGTKALRKAWHSLTGCHQIKVVPWTASHAWYLIFKNLALAYPCDGYSFHRITASLGLFPKPVKQERPDNPWLDLNIHDVQDVLGFIKSADEDTLKKSLAALEKSEDVPAEWNVPWRVSRFTRSDRMVKKLLASPWFKTLLRNPFHPATSDTGVTT